MSAPWCSLSLSLSLSLLPPPSIGEFLNSVCTDIVHLHSQKLVMYKGDYNIFERTMRDRQKNAAKAADAMDTKKKHIQAFIDRFRCVWYRCMCMWYRFRCVWYRFRCDSKTASGVHRAIQVHVLLV